MAYHVAFASFDFQNNLQLLPTHQEYVANVFFSAGGLDVLVLNHIISVSRMSFWNGSQSQFDYLQK